MNAERPEQPVEAKVVPAMPKEDLGKLREERSESRKKQKKLEKAHDLAHKAESADAEAQLALEVKGLGTDIEDTSKAIDAGKESRKTGKDKREDKEANRKAAKAKIEAAKKEKKDANKARSAIDGVTTDVPAGTADETEEAAEGEAAADDTADTGGTGEAPEGEESGGEAADEETPEQDATEPTAREIRERNKSSLMKSMDKLCETYASKLAKNPPKEGGKLWEQFGQKSNLIVLQALTSFGATGWIEDLMETDQGQLKLDKLEKAIGLQVSMNGDNVEVKWGEAEGLFPSEASNILARAYEGEEKVPKGALKNIDKDTTVKTMRDMVGDEVEGNNLLTIMEEAGALDGDKVIGFLKAKANILKANPKLEELPEPKKLEDNETAQNIMESLFGEDWENVAKEIRADLPEEIVEFANSGLLTLTENLDKVEAIIPESELHKALGVEDSMGASELAKTDPKKWRGASLALFKSHKAELISNIGISEVEFDATIIVFDAMEARIKTKEDTSQEPTP